MKTKIYNLKGKEAGEVELSDKVFGVKVKPEVVHLVFTQQTNNQREPWADTKSKAEVSGGGRKPWQQKGTGRARHGSIRSPIWKGGGVVFGPRTVRNYETKINKKVRQLAIRMCLSDKVAGGALYVVENFNFEAPKTKFFAELLKVLPLKQRSFLVLTADKDDSVLRSTRNLKKIQTRRAQDANVLDLMKYQAVITTVDGVKKLGEVFGKENNQ